MSKNIKRCFLSFAIVIGFIGSFLVMAMTMQQNVRAANLANSGNDKALATVAIDCYDSHFKTKINASKLSGEAKDFANQKGTYYAPYGSGYFHPTGDNGEGTMAVNCLVFTEQLINRKNIVVPNSESSPESITDFYVKNLGYKASSEYADCIYVQYQRSTDGKIFDSDKLCVKELDSNGRIIDKKLTVIQNDHTNNKTTIWFTVGNGSVQMKIGVNNATSDKIGFKPGETTWNELLDKISNNLISKANGKPFAGSFEWHQSTYTLLGLNGGVNERIKHLQDYTGNFTLPTEKTDNMRYAMTGFLTGNAYYKVPTISVDEQFVMYQNYLVGYFNSDIYCNWTKDEAQAYKGGFMRDGKNVGPFSEVRLYTGDGYKTCYATAMANKNNKVGGVNSSRVYGQDCNYACVVNFLNDESVMLPAAFPVDSGIMLPTEGPGPGGTVPEDPTPNPSPSPGSGSTADLDRCDGMVKEYIKEGEKIGAMQWILCPTMDNARYTASWVDEMTTDWLEAKAENYKSGSVTETAWRAVRDIANVAMVVFLIIVIFSQITGYGIDNYGIKKMLPRLIIMAIVVNLSFYICQIVVDLSNIVGVGLRDMFGAIGTEAAGEQTVAGTDFLGTMITGLFASSGGISAAVGAAVTAGTIGAPILIAVIMVVIAFAFTILVAVGTLFLMLAAREIIIILCIALSPLAFAAFILPNTQNLFKKWWDLFKAALIIYPICGAMSGISYMLRAMTMKNSGGEGAIELNWWGYAIITLLPYLGFFLLPTLLKGALAALGKVGGALSSMGQTIRNGGREIGQAGVRGVQNSQRYKDWAQFRQEQVAAQRAQRIHDRLSGRTDLTRRQQSQLRNADEVLLAQSKRDKENASRANGEYYNAAMVKQDLAVGQEQRSTELYNDPNYSAMMERHGDVALHSEREKMFSEDFADQDKVANTANLGRSLMGRDADEAAAAFTTLSSQGISETMGALYNANWNSMDASVRDKVLTRMSSSNIDSFKSFAKYRQSGGQKSFKDWMTGAGSVEHGVKDASFAAHLNDLKDHAMDAYSKDEMEFINKNAADSLRAQLGSQEFGSMLKSAAINSKDPKMQTQTEDILRRQIENGTMSASDLGITAENLGAMRGDTMKAIRQAYFNKYQKQGYNTANAKNMADMELRNGLSNQILDAKSDQRIYNRMDKDVKAILGI